MSCAAISIFKKGSEEHKKLENLAELLTLMSPTGSKYYVDDTYFDIGLDWKWTTILCESKSGTYQAISPRIQENLLIYGFDLKSLAKDVLSSRFCPDRKE